MEGALVPVVLYGVGTDLGVKVGAGWRIDLIASTVPGRTNQRPPGPRRFCCMRMREADRMHERLKAERA